MKKFIRKALIITVLVFFYMVLEFVDRGYFAIGAEIIMLPTCVLILYILEFEND